MADIGATLREARLRARIDISEVEVDTKIRAKYLRALEDEDFDRLPGPTFVRSFLRTYAEYLGLDARLLVDEYKRRWERPSEIDLMPMAPLGSRERAGRERGGRDGGSRPRPRRIRPPRPTRRLVIALALLAILSLLLVLGLAGDDEPEDGGVASTQTQTQTTRTTPRPRPRQPSTTTPRRRPTRVRLQLEPTGEVWVCLENADKRTLIAGEILTPEGDVPAYTSRSFRMTFGNGNVRMRVNGRTMSVPSRAEPVGFEVTPRGRRELSDADRPGCA